MNAPNQDDGRHPPVGPPRIDQGPTSIVVRQEVGVPAEAMFAVLVDPRRHVEIDGSGMLQAAAGTVPITAIGQVFTMAMRYPSLGDYRTDNHVVELEDGRSIAWLTAREGQRPAGVRWRWQLEPVPAGRTLVVHTYDWSQVTDPAVLARVSFPRVSAEQLMSTVAALASAAVST